MTNLIAIFRYMEKIIFLAILVTILYGILKIVEMKFIEKEWKPVKQVARDAGYVFICSAAAAFATFHLNGPIADMLNIMTQTSTLDTAETHVFTGEPDF